MGVAVMGGGTGGHGTAGVARGVTRAAPTRQGPHADVHCASTESCVTLQHLPLLEYKLHEGKAFVCLCIDASKDSRRRPGA